MKGKRLSLSLSIIREWRRERETGGEEVVIVDEEIGDDRGEEESGETVEVVVR
jgi:hypothetical protein